MDGVGVPRPVRRDVVLGVGATALLVLSVAGIFQYEATMGGGSSFRVSFTTLQVAGPGAQDQAVQGRPTVVDARIGTLNVTRVDFTLVWTDDLGAPDVFHLSVSGPHGEKGEAEGDAGRLVVSFEGLAQVPAAQRILAASAEEAQERVARTAASDAATGTWLVEVSLVRAPGLGAPAGSVELQPDGQNDYVLESALTVYQPRVERG